MKALLKVHKQNKKATFLYKQKILFDVRIKKKQEYLRKLWNIILPNYTIDRCLLFWVTDFSTKWQITIPIGTNTDTRDVLLILFLRNLSFLLVSKRSQTPILFFIEHPGSSTYFKIIFNKPLKASFFISK